MSSQHATVYRNILRELKKATVAPRRVNTTVASALRSVVEQSRASNDLAVFQDVQNALLFLRSQREHKLLLERYNPLIDLTAQERIHATARRVGLDMPTVHIPEPSQ